MNRFFAFAIFAMACGSVSSLSIDVSSKQEVADVPESKQATREFCLESRNVISDEYDKMDRGYLGTQMYKLFFNKLDSNSGSVESMKKTLESAKIEYGHSDEEWKEAHAYACEHVVKQMKVLEEFYESQGEKKAQIGPLAQTGCLSSGRMLNMYDYCSKN